MSSRRAAAVGSVGSGSTIQADTPNNTAAIASSSSSRKASGKKKTPAALFLIPLLPILFTVFMSGKSKPDLSESSFMAPPPPHVETASSLRGFEHEPEVAKQGAENRVLAPVVIQQAVTAVPSEDSQENEHDEAQQGGIPAGAVGTATGNNPLNLKLLKQDTLIQSPNTVVTAYFTLRSKFAKEEYIKWMSNMLSLHDAMVIFTSPEMVETMQNLRSHAQNRTVVIPMDLSQLQLVQMYDETFWQAQLDKDPEKRVHKSYQLFWIWLSKSFFVTTAIELDIFGSDVYMWSDIGCFRNGRYRDKEMILQRQLIPRDRIFQMAHHEPRPPPYVWWNDKYNQKPLFYHSGSQMIGYKDTWTTFHKEFLVTIDGFLKRDMFIGEDQTVLQSTCLRVPTLCAYIPSSQVTDNHYFGLRHLLHFGKPSGYTYWYPPSGLPFERDDVTDKSLLEPMKPPPQVSQDKIRAA